MKKSHRTQDQKVVVKLDDIYGMLTLLVLGLFGALLLISTELVIKELTQKNKTKDKAISFR